LSLTELSLFRIFSVEFISEEITFFLGKLFSLRKTLNSSWDVFKFVIEEFLFICPF